MIDFNAISKKYSNSRFSKFWDNSSNDSSIVDDFLSGGDRETPKTRKKDVIQLAGYKRAISNFVNIVTGQNIPVIFKSKDGGYTDGKEVVIGGNLSEKNFDTAVGLALHEGSHIKLTDFTFVPQDNIIEEIFVMAESKGFNRSEIRQQVFGLTNWVEDRRIDKFVISTSPGYKGYYHCMYDTYFNSKNIDNGLISSEYRNETWESYHFRICNLTNPNRQFGALKGLRDIWNVLDLKNIDRLKSTQDAFEVACDIYRIVMRNVNKLEVEDGQQKQDNNISDEDFQDLLDKIENGEFEIGDGEDDGETSDSGNGNGDSENSNDDENKGDGKEFNAGLSSKNSDKDSNDDGTGTKKLTDRQQELLNKAIEKQNKFLETGAKKSNMSAKDSRDIETIDKSGASYEEVGEGIGSGTNWYGTPKINKTKCLVIKKFTRSLIESKLFDFATERNGTTYDNSKGHAWRDKLDFVEEGIRLGTVLGRKLKIRGEENSIKYTRKNTGRIDKRLISELGFDNENVFSQTFVTKFNKAYLHISVDASWSMTGKKWNKAMTSAVAMIRACDMAGNIDVILSIRGTHSVSLHADTPAILVCYDSRVDKFNKVRSLFKYLSVGGTTPEGLCFEAITKDLIPGDNNQDSYFINYSDGSPQFGNKDMYYAGHTAELHTKNQVNKMRKMGIKVLGYFISNKDDCNNTQSFKKMYGADAEYIKVDNMMQVSRTMNKRFLKED